MNDLQIRVRKSTNRGASNFGWLDSKHSFSFGEYYDPNHMGFRSLRVINDDHVSGGQGFGMHPHKNMEIFSYVIEGELKHEDSIGNGRVIKAGEFQYMSAGAGILHSEFNPSDQTVHFLQIWIQPDELGGAPKYAELDTKALNHDQDLVLFASADGRDHSIQMRQKADIYFGKTDTNKSIQVPAAAYSGAWVQVIKGALNLDGHQLTPGDGASIENAQTGFELTGSEGTEFILFRLQ